MNKNKVLRTLWGMVSIPALLIMCVLLMSRCSRVPAGMPPNILVHPNTADPKVLMTMDSVEVIATDYYEAHLMDKLVQGKNYRKAWVAPVKAEILWLDTLNGGLTLVEEGGGGQTRSLELIDSAGNIFTLRTVTKNPTPSVPPLVDKLDLEEIIFDAMSAVHPYAALAVSELSDAAGVLHTQPRLVFVPYQESLDTSIREFSNRLYFLEYEAEDESGTWTGLTGVKEVIDSEDAAEEVIEHPDRSIDQKSLLYARLFDLVIGDWDRHPGQWGWAEVETDTGLVYIPIATDRDNAFYKIGGVIPRVITMPMFGSKFRPFKKKIKSMKGMLVNGMIINTFFLNRMDRDDYIDAAVRLKFHLSDDEIREAVKIAWPDTIYKLDGDEIVEKLIHRKNNIKKYALEMFEIMVRKPEIHGSEGDDEFRIISGDDGSLLIEVEAVVADEERKKIIYKRKFDPENTKEILLFSWEGDDLFILQGDGTSILIKISGEEGRNELIYPSAPTNHKWKIEIEKDDEEWKDFPTGLNIKRTKFEAMIPD